MSNTKTIAKNSLFLYLRMLLTMGIGLYTSRIVLNTLGVDDFGVYSVVNGVVVLFVFFNAAMSSATQRYLTFELGKKSRVELLKKLFNTTFIIHVGISIIIFILAETVGLWYLNNQLKFASERIFAVNCIYQLSILIAMMGVIQVPFNALLIAYERMEVFAMVSVVETLLKFLAAILLSFINFDKLILYNSFLFLISFFSIIFYVGYCKLNFSESRFSLYMDKAYYRELLSYSGWNLFGNIASTAKGQGINLLLNVFSGTVVNAAYGITIQIQGVVVMFVNNFQLAVNPQITKLYSQGIYQQMYKLIFQSSKFSYFLTLLAVFPIIMNTEYLLRLWLITAPPYTTVFVQLCLINVLIDCISTPLMTGIQATGKIRNYQIVVGGLLLLNLPISYVLLKLGVGVYSVFVVSIIIAIISLQLRLYFLSNALALNVRHFYSEVIFPIILVTISLLGMCIVGEANLPKVTNFYLLLTHIVYVILLIILLVYLLGLDKFERTMLHNVVRKKILKR